MNAKKVLLAVAVAMVLLVDVGVAYANSFGDEEEDGLGDTEDADGSGDAEDSD